MPSGSAPSGRGAPSRRGARRRWGGPALAALLALAWLALPATGSDLAAQQAHADFARLHPLAPVDLRWFAGVQPAAYSVLAPAVMAVVGVRLAGAAAAVLTTAAAVRLAAAAGARRPRLTAVLLSLGCVADVVDGRVTFACGLAAAAWALLTWTRGRRGAAAALAVTTALLSPLAGVFLAVVAIALRRGRALAMAAAAPLAALALVVPEAGRMPFTGASAWRGLGVTALVVLLTRGALRRAAGLVAAGIALAWLVPSPVGSNVLRLPLLLAPAALAAGARGPRVVVYAGLAAAVAWSAGDPVRDLRRAGEPAAEERAARDLTGLLHGLGSVTGRVEVVPLRSHGESAVVAPLARGWLRQVDRVRSPLMYDGRLDASTYRAWLDRRAVQYVALAARPLDWAAVAEADLVRSGLPYLDRAAGDGTWTVWRVRDAVPVAPGVVELGADRVVAELPGGRSVVHVRPSRWWRVDHGCLAPAGPDAVAVVLTAPARVVLDASYAAPSARCQARSAGAVRPPAAPSNW